VKCIVTSAAVLPWVARAAWTLINSGAQLAGLAHRDPDERRAILTEAIRFSLDPSQIRSWTLTS